MRTCMPAFPLPCLALALAVLLTAGGMPAAASSFREHATPYELAVYDYEVAGMCGLVTDAVASGFHRHTSRLVQAAGMDRAQVERERMHGWVAAEREWSNRGLGGFRGWCRQEGVGAADFFESVAP